MYQFHVSIPCTKSEYQVHVLSQSTKFFVASTSTKYQVSPQKHHTILINHVAPVVLMYLRYEPSAFLEYVLVILLLPQLDEGVHAGQDRHAALLAEQGPDVAWVVVHI